MAARFPYEMLVSPAFILCSLGTRVHETNRSKDADLGYWEPIAQDNEAHREKDRARPLWRRLDWIWAPAIALGMLYWWGVGNFLWRAFFWTL